MTMGTTKLDLWLVNFFSKRKKAIIFTVLGIVAFPILLFSIQDTFFVGKRIRKIELKMIHESRPLIPECKLLGNKFSDFMIVGHCLVWDLDKDKMDPVQERLPDSMTDLSSKRIGTVLMVAEGKPLEVAKYSKSNRIGYRRQESIYVVYWPKLKPVGSFNVIGSNPPEKIAYNPARDKASDKIYGEIDNTLLQWVLKHK